MLYWLLPIVALGAILRFYHLGAESLWMDEAFSWLWAHQSHGQIWGEVARWETNPPLYYSIQRLWFAFGDGEAALRSFSAAAGILTITAVFLVGRTVGGTGAGLIAALFLATSASHLAYSQEARVYALLMLATTIATWGLLVFLKSHGGLATVPGPSDRRHRRLGLVAYATGTTLALYGHNTAVFLLLLANGVALCWWLRRAHRDRQFAIEWLTANLVPLVLWLWWLPIVAMQTRTAVNVAWISQPSLPGAIVEAARLYSNRYVTIGFPWSSLVPIPLLGVVALWHWRDRWPAVAVLLVFVLGVPALTWLFGLVLRPIWIERTIVWPLGLGMVLAAGGVLAIRPPAVRAAVIGLILAVQCADLVVYYTSTLKPPWDRVVADIAADLEPADVILHFPNATVWPFTYYANRLGIAPRHFGIYKDREPQLDVTRQTIGQATEFVALREIDAVATRYARAWVVFRNRARLDPEDQVLERLKQEGTVALHGSYPPKVEIYLLTFERPRRERHIREPLD